MFRNRPTTMTFCLLLLAAFNAHAADRKIKGPVLAELVRVIDGDTVLVEAMPWPDHRIDTYVRLRGIDAPELKSKCPAFRRAAQRARDELIALMKGQSTVVLTTISGDKYFGRVVADLALEDGSSPAQLLLNAGLVTPYFGKAKAKGDCPDRDIQP